MRQRTLKFCFEIKIRGVQGDYWDLTVIVRGFDALTLHLFINSKLIKIIDLSMFYTQYLCITLIETNIEIGVNTIS